MQRLWHLFCVLARAQAAFDLEAWVEQRVFLHFLKNFAVVLLFELAAGGYVAQVALNISARS